MKKNILTKCIAAALMAVTLTTTITACNKKIDVDMGYKASDYVTLGDYKNIDVEIDKTSIENQCIEDAIKEDQQDNTTYSDVDRGAVKTDKILFNVNATYAGLTIADLSANGQTLILGVDSFPLNIDGVEEMLYGMKPGDVNIKIITLPENYPNTTYAGANVVFEVTMTEVAQAQVPMVTDAYVKQYYGYDTVQEYREHIKEEVTNDVNEKVDDAKKEAVLTKLTEICNVSDIPQSLYDEKTEQFNTSINFYATLMGKSNDEYCQTNFNMTFDEYVRKSCEQRLILEAIIESEDLKMTEYRYKGDLDDFASANGFSKGSLMEDKYGKNTICIGMLVEEAQQLVLDNAKVEYK